MWSVGRNVKVAVEVQNVISNHSVCASESELQWEKPGKSKPINKLCFTFPWAQNHVWKAF